jgi:hypothetical protein
MKLTWKDIAYAHSFIRLPSQLYKSEREIFEREAEYLNKQLANRARIKKLLAKGKKR